MTPPIFGENQKVTGGKRVYSGWWFPFFKCSPLFGEDSHFDEHIIFFKWVETTIFVEEILHQVEIYRILHQVQVDMNLISTVIFLIDYGKNIRSLKLTVRP